MISILIPTYNFDCCKLVNELQRQITAHHITAEVLVMDDASPNVALREANKVIERLPNCRHIQLESNVGIARIRNRLADEAQYRYLLFLDSDVFPVNDNFIKKYLDAARHSDVVCGGLQFRAIPPSPQCSLRYTYGNKVESQSVAQRMQEPYGQFKTLSFIIARDAFMQVRFNEEFTRYGHEDTLFGKELEAKGYSITHIDNPIYHDVPDTNEQFVAKTQRSIENLKQHKEVLTSHVKLLRFYDKLHKWHLTAPIALIYSTCKKALLCNLLSKHPSLFLFNIYKVSYLCHIMRQG